MNLGIVGTGHMTTEILPLLPQWGYTITALCGTVRSQETVIRMAAAHHIPSTYTDYKEMLQDDSYEVIYIAVPNHLHYSFAREALLSGKHVILEKPFTSNITEAKELERLTKETNRFLYEAISTIYLPNYHKLQELLPSIGKIEKVHCEFCQYSSRYDAFKSGEVLPVFDPAKSGGALMDLNVYNIYWVYGLFGAPLSISYEAQLERAIDVGGTVYMKYPNFVAECVAAKNKATPFSYEIIGDKGSLHMDSPANFCLTIEHIKVDGSIDKYELNPDSRLESEFLFFRDSIASGDIEGCYKALTHSIEVSSILTSARVSAEIRFPADE